MKQCIHCTSVHVVSTYFSVTGQILYYTVLKLFGCPAHCLPLRCPVCSCCQEFPVCCQISSSLIPHSLIPTVLPGVTKPNFLIFVWLLVNLHIDWQDSSRSPPAGCVFSYHFLQGCYENLYICTAMTIMVKWRGRLKQCAGKVLGKLRMYILCYSL